MPQPGFRSLPFQFQQRGPDLAGATQDASKFGRFTEARDQDLENYLANLHGIPAGGTAGQVLAKVDGTDYNADWETSASGFDNVCFYAYMKLGGSSLGPGVTFDSSADTWDGVEVIQTTGTGITTDVRRNVVLPAGWWQLNFSLNFRIAQFSTFTAGDLVYFDAHSGNVTWFPQGLYVPVLETPGSNRVCATEYSMTTRNTSAQSIAIQLTNYTAATTPTNAASNTSPMVFITGHKLRPAGTTTNILLPGA